MERRVGGRILEALRNRNVLVGVHWRVALGVSGRHHVPEGGRLEVPFFIVGLDQVWHLRVKLCSVATMLICLARCYLVFDDIKNDAQVLQRLMSSQ